MRSTQVGILVKAVEAAVDRLAGPLVEAVGAAIRIPSVTPSYPGERYEDHVGAEGQVSQLVAALTR